MVSQNRLRESHSCSLPVAAYRRVTSVLWGRPFRLDLPGRALAALISGSAGVWRAEDSGLPVEAESRSIAAGSGSPAVSAGDLRRRSIWFAASSVAILVLFWRPLLLVLQFSFSRDEYSYIPLIPLVSLCLLLWRRREFFTELKSSPRLGAAVLILGLVLLGVGLKLAPVLDQNDDLSWKMSAVVLFFLGAFLLCYGQTAFRKALFPMLFLLLMIPIPSHLLDRIIYWLQQGSSDASYAFFNIMGVPVFRRGFIFDLPGLSIEVAKECSGIHSSVALFITCLLAGYLMVPSKLERFLLCLTVVPIAIFKNGVRIVTLATLTVYVNPNVINSPLHHKGGVVFFIPALLVLGLEIWLLEKLDKRRRLARA